MSNPSGEDTPGYDRILAIYQRPTKPETVFRAAHLAVNATVHGIIFAVGAAPRSPGALDQTSISGLVVSSDTYFAGPEASGDEINRLRAQIAEGWEAALPALHRIHPETSPTEFHRSAGNLLILPPNFDLTQVLGPPLGE